jgi:hypothetical protein
VGLVIMQACGSALRWVSPFVRQAIILDLLGWARLPERPGMYGGVAPQPLRWERDEEMPVREVGHFDGVGETQEVWREEPEAKT